MFNSLVMIKPLKTKNKQGEAQPPGQEVLNLADRQVEFTGWDAQDQQHAAEQVADLGMNRPRLHRRFIFTRYPLPTHRLRRAHLMIEDTPAGRRSLMNRSGVLALGTGGFLHRLAATAYPSTRPATRATTVAWSAGRPPTPAPASRRYQAGQANTVEAPTCQGNATYGVLVTKPSGSSVEVQLDKNDHVLGLQPAGQDSDGDDG